MDRIKGKLLIVDDHKNVLKALKSLLESEFELVHTCSNPNQIPNLIGSERYDVFLLDMNFSAGINTGNEGLFWMKEILKRDPLAVIVFITAYGDVEMAVKALKEGANDFVLKPWDNEKLVATLKSAWELRQSKLKIHNLLNKQKHLSENLDKHYNEMLGVSPQMKKIFETIKKVAGTDANILILGENGTGKELVAREIHKQSKRAGEVLISVDLGSLSESLFESEMYGHVKGSFTDAKEDRTGRFETASGGTLFLDEIGNLSVSMQSKLLTSLQDRQVVPVGANKHVPFDIRLICATNKNMKELIEQNLFRQDLLFRINTIEINIPPLRERGEDIILLSEYFLKLYSNKYEKNSLRINSKAVNSMMEYTWPGNVRELQHTIEKAVILSETKILRPEDLFLPCPEIQNIPENKPKKFYEIEKQAIINALNNNKGSVYKAARELGLARQTLYNKIQKHKL